MPVSPAGWLAIETGISSGPYTTHHEYKTTIILPFMVISDPLRSLPPPLVAAGTAGVTDPKHGNDEKIIAMVYNLERPLATFSF